MAYFLDLFWLQSVAARPSPARPTRLNVTNASSMSVGLPDRFQQKQTTCLKAAMRPCLPTETANGKWQTAISKGPLIYRALLHLSGQVGIRGHSRSTTYREAGLYHQPSIVCGDLLHGAQRLTSASSAGMFAHNLSRVEPYISRPLTEGTH